MKKLIWILTPLHLLLMALVPVPIFVGHFLGYGLILTRPLPVLIVLTALSAVAAVLSFFAYMDDFEANFFTALLGYLDFLLAAFSAMYLMVFCGTRLSTGIAALLLLSALLILVVLEGNRHRKLLYILFYSIPGVLCLILAIIVWITAQPGLPAFSFRETPSPNGGYTAIAQTMLDDNDVYSLTSVEVARTGDIMETALFRLYPKAADIREKNWNKTSVRNVEWISDTSLLINGIEYPISGARTLPVSTDGL